MRDLTENVSQEKKKIYIYIYSGSSQDDKCVICLTLTQPKSVKALYVWTVWVFLKLYKVWKGPGEKLPKYTNLIFRNSVMLLCSKTRIFFFFFHVTQNPYLCPVWPAIFSDWGLETTPAQHWWASVPPCKQPSSCLRMALYSPLDTEYSDGGLCSRTLPEKKGKFQW